MITAQAPINSGFTAASTADDVIKGISLKGKVAIITGGYSGLGLETARVFLNAGARVIIPARDVEKAKKSLANLPDAELWPMDLLDTASIDTFAARFLREKQPLHILVNSAGIIFPELARDAHGHEFQFSTNHLGHFRLTLQLWPALLQAGGARVISVSSMGHRYSPVIFSDVDFNDRPYDPLSAYAQSKTANVLFAVELDKRGANSNIRAFSLHPGGIIDTGFHKHFSVEDEQAYGAVDADGNPIIDPSRGLKTPAQGAATQVWCATSPQLDGLGGVYCENSDIAPLLELDKYEIVGVDALTQPGVMRHATDPAAASQLWHLSEQLTGLRLRDSTS